MREGEAVARQSFRVERGAWLEFCPEPLVPHQNSHYRQTTEIEVAEGGALFFSDVLMPGRMARGETWAWGRLRLELSLRIAGKLVLRERLDQSGEALRGLAELAGGAEGVCMANMILVAPTLAVEGSWAQALRVLHRPGVWVGLSRLRSESAWSLKIVASDSVELRKTTARVREILAEPLVGMRADARKV